MPSTPRAQSPNWRREASERARQLTRRGVARITRRRQGAAWTNGTKSTSRESSPRAVQESSSGPTGALGSGRSRRSGLARLAASQEWQSKRLPPRLRLRRMRKSGRWGASSRAPPLWRSHIAAARILFSAKSVGVGSVVGPRVLKRRGLRFGFPRTAPATVTAIGNAWPE